MSPLKLFLGSRSVAFLFCLAVAAAVGVSPAAAASGNGVVEPGEDCDDGSSNGSTNSCCNSSCFFSGKAPDVVVGDLTGTDAIVWSQTKGNAYTPSPVVFDNKLYVLTDTGMVSCYNAKTGEPYYHQTRLPKTYSF